MTNQSRLLRKSSFFLYKNICNFNIYENLGLKIYDVIKECLFYEMMETKYVLVKVSSFN